jgi:ABC-type nitrate/sulfonate/bicarbonate transport system permease component
MSIDGDIVAFAIGILVGGVLGIIMGWVIWGWD